MVDLNQTIEIEYREKVNKAGGGVMIRAMVPGITKDYSMPLHLTPEQAEVLGDPTSGTRFKVKLVQGSLKDGKDGSWPSDFWYNVAIFEGVVDERNIKKESFLDSVKSVTDSDTDMPKVVPTPQPKVAPPAQAPTFEDREERTRESIVGQSSTANAVKITIALVQLGHVDPNERAILHSISLLQPGLKDFAEGNYKESPLVEEALKQGAKIVEIRPSPEIEYDYEEPKPRSLKTNADFLKYTQECGWSNEDVKRWLDDTIPSDWVKLPSKTWREAARVCKEKALEEGLEPPEDFRQEKKETK